VCVCGCGLVVTGGRGKKKTTIFDARCFYGPYQSYVLEHVSHGGLPYAPLLLLKVIKARRVRESP